MLLVLLHIINHITSVHAKLWQVATCGKLWQVVRYSWHHVRIKSNRFRSPRGWNHSFQIELLQTGRSFLRNGFFDLSAGCLNLSWRLETNTNCLDTALIPNKWMNISNASWLRTRTPSPPIKSFPIKSPWVKLSGRLPIEFNGHGNSHPSEFRVCSSETPLNRNS